MASFHSQVVEQLRIGQVTPGRLWRRPDAVTEIERFATYPQLYNGEWHAEVVLGLISEPDDDPGEFSNPLGLLIDRMKGVTPEMVEAIAAEQTQARQESEGADADEDYALALDLDDLVGGHAKEPSARVRRLGPSRGLYDPASGEVTPAGHAFIERELGPAEDTEDIESEIVVPFPRAQVRGTP